MDAGDIMMNGEGTDLVRMMFWTTGGLWVTGLTFRSGMA